MNFCMGRSAALRRSAYDAYTILVKAIENAKSTTRRRSGPPSRTSRLRRDGRHLQLSPTDHNGLNVDAFEMRP